MTFPFRKVVFDGGAVIELLSGDEPELLYYLAQQIHPFFFSLDNFIVWYVSLQLVTDKPS